MEYALSDLGNQLSDLTTGMSYSLIGSELPDEKMIYDFFQQYLNSLQVIELDCNIGGESWRGHYEPGCRGTLNFLGLKTISFTF